MIKVVICGNENVLHFLTMATAQKVFFNEFAATCLTL